MSDKDLRCEVHQFEEDYIFPLNEAVRKGCGLWPHQLNASFIYPEKNIELKTFHNISHGLKSKELRLIEFGIMIVIFKKRILTRLRTQTIFVTVENKRGQNLLVFPEVTALPEVVNNPRGIDLKEGEIALRIFSRRLFEECLSNLGERQGLCVTKVFGPAYYHVIPLF